VIGYSKEGKEKRGIVRGVARGVVRGIVRERR